MSICTWSVSRRVNEGAAAGWQRALVKLHFWSNSEGIGRDFGTYMLLCGVLGRKGGVCADVHRSLIESALRGL